MQANPQFWQSQALLPPNPILGLNHFVVLVDPSVGNRIIVGCSDGFEELCGYTRNEVLGQPCTFMMEGCQNDDSLVRAMNTAMLSGDEFLGVLMNRKKSGRLFSNLLHIFSVVVRGRRYVLQVQADVSAVSVNLSDNAQVSRLRQVAVAILSSDLDAWVFQQHADFCSRYLQPSAPMSMHQVYAQEMPIPPARTELPIPNIRMGLDASLMAQEPKLQDIPASPPRAEIPLVPDRQPFRWADAASDSKPPPEFFDTPTSMGQQDLDGGYLEEAFLPAQTASKGPAPSTGSANHPNGCTECQFHFFSTAGCRMGADCRFCHLLHPRKCEKKNRKLLRRMEENSKQHENSAVVPGGATILGAEEGVNVITFRYLKETNPRASGGRPPRVTFPIGAKLKLVPTIEFDRPEVGQAVLANAVFGITPDLPAGLAMNPATGIIVGVASEASPRDLYSIILGAPATSASGESLGLVPLAKCGMSIRISFPKPPKERDDPCATQVGILPPEVPTMTAYDRQAGG
mmetsp:Transcript_1001/g.1680  ORF Transcript_1001/g.1680 Transcript_1001/m.1680 type:complete len:515 (-) Transcript_1001:168-1712(-)